MGPIQVVVEDGNNIVLEVTPTPDTTVILDRGIPGPVGPMGDGDVDGPASSTDNAVARFDGTTGKVIQNSNVTIDDSGNLTYSAGVASGVAYLNGSKVLTTGSGFNTDGTNIGVGVGATSGQRVYARTATDTGTAYLADNGVNTGFIVRFEPSTTLFGNDFNQPLVFLTNNTEQMRLTSTGLGIGTSSPTQKLDVNGNISLSGAGTSNRYVALLNETNTYAGTLMLQAGGGSSGFGGGVTMYGHSHATYPGAVWLGCSSGTSTGIIFGRGGNGPVDEYMRLTPTGLGIGTSSPAQKLHVQSATPVVQIQDTTSAAGGVGGTINFVGFTSGTSGANVEAQIKGVKSSANAAGELQFFTSNSAGTSTQRAIIDGSGNVGIGTSSPGYKLDVNGTAGFAGVTVFNGGANILKNTGELAWRDSGGTAQNVLFMFSDNNVYLSSPVTGSSLVFRGVGFAERMRLDSSGNLGLGVTPSAWDSVFKSVDGGGSGCFGSLFFQTNGDYTTALGSNLYYNSGWKYKASAAAGKYELKNNTHAWFTAPSGTAGNAISFTQALSLTAVGNLLLGGTTDPGGTKVLYIGNGTTPGTPTDGGVLYVESGALKYKGSSGTVTTLGVA